MPASDKLSQKPVDSCALTPPVRRPADLRLALYQPDIAPNVGAALRLGACLGVAIDLIEPFGFVYHPARLRRSGLDYAALAAVRRHASFTAFQDWRHAAGRRLVLLTTAAAQPYIEFAFRPDDVLMAGRESAGVPGEVQAGADARLVVPMLAGRRSLNVVTACAIVLGEALRQGDPSRT
jgi:tRNA (cytidine/uridine-2'-O-)-methyltransferase